MDREPFFRRKDGHFVQDGGEDRRAGLQRERSGGGGLHVLRHALHPLPEPDPGGERGGHAAVRDGRVSGALDVAVGGVGDRRDRRPAQSSRGGCRGGHDLRVGPRSRGGARLHDAQVHRAGARGGEEPRGDGQDPGGRVHGCGPGRHGDGAAAAPRRRPPGGTDAHQARAALQRGLSRPAALDREAFQRAAEEGGQGSSSR